MRVSYEQTPLLGKLTLTCQLTAKTGLHIGGGGENLDIGGLDKPVIRDPLTKYPYLPGSSIKGKFRATLERLLNKPLNRTGGSGTWRYESDDLVDGFTEVEAGQFISYEGATTCQISRLFGSTGGSGFWMPIETATNERLFSDKNPTRIIANQNCVKINRGRNAPSRLIIRDCHLSTESADKLKKVDTGLYMTEWKFENGIDRVTAAANPRQLERVPADSKFNFELIYTVENPDQAVEDLQNIAIALAFLEDDALGGHGSRGYGKVKFENFLFNYRSLEHYRQMANAPQGTSALQTLDTIPHTQALLDNFRALREYIEQRLLPGNGS
ncbi:type III-A CRISPR-associated RAMP protein Csm3 [Trichormus variabilis]|uniref:CRISPR system Cms endoribonuclease Csm3 n=1 Tax=Trichormus variabilis SAG 1403-4b TaxID=447716 RepID=A0A433ULT5_ANAVA|nr:type III-A CRISPR-associated RAMP protein Csm3 [Trichormus variabilis]MBD2628670.1 type III-A CRISPR-associated RAMP protein Csm3 [Trichormus variabilis FACHB-164]RUS94739.1 type III-A CRISPR-associated RAMP protein Csm3 [Trichormus variabilis SAG 1403-4b]